MRMRTREGGWMSVSLPQCAAAVRSIVSMVCVTEHGARGSCREPLIRVRQPTPPCSEGIGSTTLHACSFHSSRGGLEDNSFTLRTEHTLFLFSDERHRGTDSTLRYIIYSPHGTSASAAPSVCSRHLNPTNRSPIEPPFRGGWISVGWRCKPP